MDEAVGLERLLDEVVGALLIEATAVSIVP